MEKLESIENPNLLPILTKNQIYSLMTHRYTSQKDITYGKAEDYVITGKIFDIQCTSDASEFIAKSMGSYNKIYSCRLYFTNKRLTSFSCDCPSYVKWHTLCKHLIGMMIAIEKYRQKLLRVRKSRMEQSSYETQYIPNKSNTTYQNKENEFHFRTDKEENKTNYPENDIPENEIHVEKQQYQPEKKTAFNDQNNTNKNSSEQNNDNSGCLTAIIIYVIASVIIGLMIGNVGYGFIASIILLAIYIFIKKIYF